MAEVEIAPIPQEEIPGPLASFLARLNQDPAHYIGYCDETPEAVADTLARVEPSAAETFRVARVQGRIVGALGFDADPQLGRAWLHGPLVEPDDWDSRADALWAAIQPLLPPSISQLELFYDLANLRVDGFARRHRFTLLKDSAILRLDRLGASRISLPPVEPLAHSQHPALAALHDLTFPATHRPSPALLDSLDPRHAAFTVGEGGALLGYVYATVKPQLGEATIEYLAVREEARGQGLGRRLVATAVQWMFGHPGVERTFLVVDADNASARRLYAGLGYQQLHQMRAMRLAR